jgi:hypothetical protein
MADFAPENHKFLGFLAGLQSVRRLFEGVVLDLIRSNRMSCWILREV